VSAGALACWSLLESLAPTSTATQELVAAVAKNLAAGMLVVAGVLWLACWRLTGDWITARVAAAMLVLGVGLPEVTAVGPLLHETGPLARFAPSTRALIVLPVVALLLPARRWDTPATSRPLPGSHAALVLGATAAGLVALVVARHEVPTEWLSTSWQVTEALLALAWLLLAVRATRTDLTSSASDHWPGLSRGLPLSFALLALSDLLRLLAIGGTMPAKGLAPGCQLAAAGLVLVTATAQLRSEHRRQDEETADLTHALVTVRQALTRLERSGRERLHDARSAVAGVIGAAELLAQARPATLATARAGLEDVVAPLDRDHLRRLIAGELERLQCLLDASYVEEVVELDLCESLTGIVEMHRLDGLGVQTELWPVVVRGRQRVLATVLDNLLRNVRTHAPGARAWVRVEAVGDQACVVVEDDGPGIPEAERRRVLQPGVRGSTARGDGDGLGLSSALAAMTAQNGTLTVDGGRRGGTRVTLLLPLVTTDPAHATAGPLTLERPAVIVLPDSRPAEALAG
jgi:signal transduction histidine kinase